MTKYRTATSAEDNPGNWAAESCNETKLEVKSHSVEPDVMLQSSVEKIAVQNAQNEGVLVLTKRLLSGTFLVNIQFAVVLSK